jgi:putative transposase
MVVICGVMEVILPLEEEIDGMGVTELRKLRQLEDENRKLKSLAAYLILAKHMLQEFIATKL